MIRHIIATALVLTLMACQNAHGGQSKKPMPSFDKVTKTVLKNFKKQNAGDPEAIISQSQVRPIFGQLKRLGWIVAEEKQILEAVPSDSDFVVRQLRTPAGEKFMRQAGSFPEAYDRLDRLSRLPHGQQTVRDLIRGPDGYKMIQYMTTSRGGVELGKMLSKDPGGKGFNQPTGRIYTVKMLLARLKTEYADATGKTKSKTVKLKQAKPKKVAPTERLKN